MGTDLAPRGIEAPTPQMSVGMSPQDLHAHRAGIISEVQTVLSAYFQPNDPPDIATAQLAWWADELQDWTREQVVWGMRKWNRDSPDRRPTPGHILAILKRQRGIMVVQRRAAVPEPPREDARADRATAEATARIIEETGLNIRRVDF